MVAEGTPAIFVTYLLAITGYVGLTYTAWATVNGRFSKPMWRLIAIVIVAHVVMVWMVRYSWKFDLAVRNGYLGFLLFHAALVIIVISTMVRDRLAHLLIHASFCVVTLGASGAVFLYDDVALYRIPVIVCALAGGYGLIRHYAALWRAREVVP